MILNMSAFKMSNSVCFTIFVVVVLFNIRTGHGLKCYICTWSSKESKENHCTDPFVASDKTKSIECESCLKSTGYDKNGNELVLVRGCSKAGSCNGKDKIVQEDLSLYCYYCSEDLCNSAPASSQIIWLAIVAPLVTFLFRK